MRKHTRRFATALATTVAVSLSVFGLAVSASATETADLPFIESAMFSSVCYDNGPGAQGVINVVIPEGSDPVEVSVAYDENGSVLFGGTLTETGMVTGGGALPLGDYDLTILLNGTPTGSGLVSAVSCEEVANPGGEPDSDGGSTDVPAPVTTTDPVVVEGQVPAPAPVKAVAPVATVPVAKAPIVNAVPKGNTDGYDMQSASSESSFGVGAAGIVLPFLLLGLFAMVGWRRKTLASK